MNKLRELHKKILDTYIEEFENYSEDTYTEDNSLEEIQAFECAEITKDIAKKYLSFIEDNYSYYDSCWHDRETDKHVKRDEIFNIFIEKL